MVQVDSVFGEATLLGSYVEGSRELWGGGISSIRSSNPFLRPPRPWPKHFPKPPPPNAITLGIRFHHENFEVRDTNIKTIAMTL